ncbi:hypothetical protein NLJ89_g228 [Agrocybe chaxingu]|uniref:Metallo-dependent hydrolase n=1 Tax=Agrocybe chaxingu TaxID=84603 RepID=A0A9W8N299_9AGAR|nr:hypothetical protein NLJ89_g228 [Agrocybe chaxingu]
MSAPSNPDAQPSDLPPSSVLSHIVDVHCHPTDAPDGVAASAMDSLVISICAMSSMQTDQAKVKALASAYPEKVTSAFAPSTSKSSDSPPLVSSKERHYRSLFFPNLAKPNAAQEAQFQALLPRLPNPRPLSTILDEVRANLTLFPNSMLGEVGLDRAFRVPIDYSASPRILTPFTIPLEHQLRVLEAQIDLAVELRRNVSVHSVKAQQQTVELLSKMKVKHGLARWNRISVDMHSCGLSVQTWRDLEKKHVNVFLSLSVVINHKHANLRELIASCGADRILVESDFNDINMCTSWTWVMVRIISEVRGWPIETEWIEDDASLEEKDWGVVRRLWKNWLRFKNGNHPTKEKAKRNKRRDYDSEGSDIQEIGK